MAQRGGSPGKGEGSEHRALRNPMDTFLLIQDLGQTERVEGASSKDHTVLKHGEITPAKMSAHVCSSRKTNNKNGQNGGIQEENIAEGLKFLTGPPGCSRHRMFKRKTVERRDR